MSNSNKDVEIFHRINKLKIKAGIERGSNAKGFIDPNAINRAQKRIDEKENEYPLEVKELLGNIQAIWEEMKKNPDVETEENIQIMYNFANNVKDITATYKDDLMHHFGLSLRNFCEKIDLEKKEHHIIVQAHIDVMWITHDEKLRDSEGAKAKELQKVVAMAIEKYS